MSTNDVPGYNPAHRDELAMGCWAEHEDGSLILVESAEGGYVVYSVFDLDVDPIIEYRDKMAEGAFKKAFSWPTDTGDKWTWHDKTPFPWDDVIGAGVKAGPRHADADALMSAASRVAKHRAMRSRQFDYSRFASKLGAGARTVRDKIQRAIGELRS